MRTAIKEPTVKWSSGQMGGPKCVETFLVPDSVINIYSAFHFLTNCLYQILKSTMELYYFT